VTLTNAIVLPNGSFQLSFTNVPGALFNVFGTTNLSESLANWTWLGEAAEISSGQFQFTDASTTNTPERFYSVVAP
jgi:hypothetical protein